MIFFILNICLFARPYLSDHFLLSDELSNKDGEGALTIESSDQLKIGRTTLQNQYSCSLSPSI